jgi:hypothetical protein
LHEFGQLPPADEEAAPPLDEAELEDAEEPPEEELDGKQAGGPPVPMRFQG